MSKESMIDGYKTHRLIKDVPKNVVCGHIKELKELFSVRVKELLDDSYTTEIRNLCPPRAIKFMFAVNYGFRRSGVKTSLAVIDKIADLCIMELLIKNTETASKSLRKEINQSWAEYNREFPKP